jgi:transcriptional regulator with XRE-family HTH domain
MAKEKPADPPELLRTLGQRLKSERSRLGLTQVQLARIVEVTERAIQQYELGKNTIRMDILYKMDEVGVNVDFLLFGDRDHLRHDPAIWDRVNRWADDACRDRNGDAFPEPVRHQRVLRAYEHVVRGRTPEEVQERLEQLNASRAA